MFKPAFQPLLLALVFGLLAWRESHEAWFAPVQQTYMSWLQGNAGGPGQQAPVFLVEIPEASSKEAWQPVDYALALNTIAPLQSAVLAIAPVLAWPERNGRTLSSDQQQYLTVLHDKLLTTAKPLLSSQLGMPDDPDIAPIIEAVPAIRKINGDSSQLQEFPVIAEKADDTLRLTGQTGFTDESNQPEGRVPLVFRYHGQVVPSFVLQAAVLWSGHTLDEVTVTPGSAIQIGSALRIPIDATGGMASNPQVLFGHAQFEDVMLGVTQMQHGQPSDFPPGAWKKDIVLLGSEPTAAPLAEALATITLHAYPRSVGLGLEALWLLPACWLAALFSRWPRLTACVAGVTALLVYMVLVLSIYGAASLVLPLLAPMAIILLGMIVAALPRPSA